MVSMWRLEIRNLHLESSAARTERSLRAYVRDKSCCRTPTLRWLLIDFFHAALYDDSRAGVVFYPDQSRAAIKLIYRRRDLVHAIAGPSLTRSTLEELQRRVDSEILSSVGRKIGRAMFLSEKSVEGYFRHKDSFQILPPPANAPRPDLSLPGLYPRHPFVVEVSFEASSNDVLSGLRRFRTQCELELALNALLDGSVSCTTTSARRYRWVLSPKEDRQGSPASVFVQDGYRCSGFSAESSQFSRAESIPKLREVEPSTYYQLIWAPSMPLGLPSDFSIKLNSFHALARTEREAWLRACHWLRHSSVAVWDSRSAAFVALVTAVEALMPRRDRGKRREFELFIDRFAPGRGLQQDRLRFYRIRSELAHGVDLRYEDSDHALVSITPRISEGLREFEAMRSVAKSVIVNWLEAAARP
jgi:hypothetical protein